MLLLLHMRRPLLLSSLSTFTLLYILCCIVFCFMNWLDYETTGDMVKFLGDVNFGLIFLDVPLAAFYLPMILFYLLAAFGVVKMMKTGQGGLSLFVISMLAISVCTTVPMMLMAMFVPELTVLVGINLLTVVGFVSLRKHFSR